jgi:hypothetical protein
MITQDQINYIMQELGLDPANTEARKVVERLVSSRPNASIDKHFIATLREDIQTHARQYTTNHSTNYFSNFMNKILASALIVMVVLVAGGVWYIQKTDKPLFKTPQSSEVNQLLSGKYDVKALDQESFGDLAKVSIVNNKNNNASSPTQAPSTNSSGSENSKLAAPNDGGDSNIPPYPGPINYVFNYAGADLSTLPDTQDVLKRNKPSQDQSIVTRIVSMISFGLIDLSRFTNLKMQNASFVEDGGSHYGINVDFTQGNVGIYQNLEGGTPPYDCKSAGMSEFCGSVKPLKPEDVPSDEDMIAVANQFLANYNISREGYGEPQVVDTWRAQYANAVTKSIIWIPEQVQVVYPLQLEGQNVLDESGIPSGMNVMVGVRSKQVTNMYDLITKQFEKSQYKGETSTKRILDIAERGGFRNYNYIDPNGKKVQLQLETPTKELVKIWYSSDNYQTNNELYVPALVFPIKNWEKAGYWRKNVIVPLVKDLLDTDQSEGQPIPVDQPVNSQSSANTETPPKPVNQ